MATFRVRKENASPLFQDSPAGFVRVLSNENGVTLRLATYDDLVVIRDPVTGEERRRSLVVTAAVQDPDDPEWIVCTAEDGFSHGKW